MEFLVKLIEVIETANQTARNDLKTNCTHVGNNYWLFEGNEDSLDKGINFSVVGEESIESYGDLAGTELVSMVREVYNVDKCFLTGD